MKKFEIEIINYFEKEEPVAEIYYDSQQWAELSYSEEDIVVEFYSHADNKYWEFLYEESIKVLEQAKTKLLITRNKKKTLYIDLPGNSEQMNEEAQKILEEIVNHPDKEVISSQLERFGEVVDIYLPDKKGVRYSKNGNLIGFLER